MIHARALAFKYEHSNFTLRISNFGLAQSEKVGIVGPSGAGKTTFLKLIAGILSPREGDLQVAGVAVHRLSDDARRAFRIRNIGFVFQELELLDYLSVFDNIVHSYRLNPALALSPRVCERASELARAAGLGEQLDRKPSRLSQGERQRVAICRALLPQPPLLLADEATGNLDPANKRSMLDLLCRCAEAAGSSLLAVTHDHELLRRFDRVVDFRDLQ